MKMLINNQQKLNDIIFAGRNQKYGAYAIRAEYDSSVIKSLLIVFSSTLLFAAAAYFFNRPAIVEAIKSIDLANQLDSVKIIKMDIEDMFKKKVAITTPDKPSGGAKSENLVPKVIDSTAVSTATVLNDTPVSTATAASTSTNTGLPVTNTLTAVGNGTLVSRGGNGLPPRWADEMPEFEGGLGAIRKFISQNISYPEKAKINEREGVVNISFVVDELGNVVDVKVEEGIGSGCDEEAARVVGKLPKFKKPGKNGGKPVKVMFNIPIKFKLQ